MGRRVTPYWVPGHVGVDDNEQTDRLAKTGTPLVRPEPFYGMEEHTIRWKLRKEEELERAKLCREVPKVRQTKALIGNFNRRKSKICINLNRINLRILKNSLTGHCKLREHPRLIKQREVQFLWWNQRKSGSHTEKLWALIRIGAKCLRSHQMEEKNISSLFSSRITPGGDIVDLSGRRAPNPVTIHSFIDAEYLSNKRSFWRKQNLRLKLFRFFSDQLINNLS